MPRQPRRPPPSPGRAGRLKGGADIAPAEAVPATADALPSPEPGAAETRLRMLTDILDNMDAMVAYWNREQVCEFANAAYLHWFGKTREQIVGRTLKELLGPLYAMNLPYIDAAFAGQRQVFERRIPLPDGTARDSLATYTPHRVDGRVMGIFVHVADVTPLKQAQEELRLAKEHAEAQAAHDPLTGLPNRLLLRETVGRAIAAALRDRESLALMVIDADHFKEINDRYGHEQGDRMLVELAQRLRGSLRACDTVFRVGGDEFVALAPAIGSTAEAELLANRILAATREPLPLADVAVATTVSIGVAMMPRSDATPDTLLAAADRALYEAKGSGRDRLVVAP